MRARLRMHRDVLPALGVSGRAENAPRAALLCGALCVFVWLSVRVLWRLQSASRPSTMRLGCHLCSSTFGLACDTRSNACGCCLGERWPAKQMRRSLQGDTRHQPAKRITRHRAMDAWAPASPGAHNANRRPFVLVPKLSLCLARCPCLARCRGMD